jgi:predicted DNA-binding protein YlxM (UPF0122 family)
MSKHSQRYNILRPEEKVLIVKNLLENDLSIPDISKAYQIGESTIRDWLKKIDYDVNNLEKLKEIHSSQLNRKRPIITELPEWVQQEIHRILKDHPEMGALKLKQHFFRHHQVLLSEKKIYYYLKENGILEQRRSVKPGDSETPCRRFEYPYPLAAVQLDLLTIQLVNKMKIYLVSFLDDYSRYILRSQFIKTKTMEEVIGVLMQTVKQHGPMERIICDKGSEFVSWQSFTKFESRLCELDVELIASGPGTPQNQGKIERWHKTYRQECERRHNGFDSYVHAQTATDHFINYYNYERVHQGIGGLVPADRYYGLSDDIQRELSQYHQGNHEEKCIYFSCNINGRRLVVSGPRNGQLTVYQNISGVSSESEKEVRE